MWQHRDEGNWLSRTIASTATLKLAHPPLLDLFYTPLEERFERITRLARRTLSVPVAAITLVNAEKQWFKSVAGWSVSELPRRASLCTLTLERNDLHVIADTHADPRTRHHPLVVATPKFRFYAGFPLTDPTDMTVGTFCVFDLKPRRMSDADRRCILDLAAIAQREFADDHICHAHAALAAKLGVARREAMMDPLTRLWNRRGASVLAESALQRADRSGEPLGIVVIDLDTFKQVNDTLGHHAGDDVLRRIGERLVGCVRPDDAVCRLGGDEFLVVVANGDESTTATIAERIRCGITETPVPTRNGGVQMSASVGYTIREPRDDVSFDALVQRADRALMRSKGDGRNRVSRTG